MPDNAIARSDSQTTSDILNLEQQEREAEEWSCPRCTLLNPARSQQCELCEFDRTSQRLLSAEETNDDIHFRHLQHKFMIRFEPLNPLVANNVIGSTTSIASSTLVGGILGGPVGAIIGATGAAVLDGASRLNQFLNRNNRGHHRMILTTVRMIGSSMSITMKTTARVRNMIVQPMIVTDRSDGGSEQSIDHEYWSQLTHQDIRMLQIMLLHVICDNSIRDDDVLILSREELMERITGTMSEVRGASPECIESNSESRILEDPDLLNELKDFQKVCNICLEDFKQGDAMRELKPCAHTFHKECIDQWLGKVASCPICKHELSHAEKSTN